MITNEKMLKKQNAAQILSQFLWKEGNQLPLTAVKGSIFKGFEIDQQATLEFLFKFQEFLFATAGANTVQAMAGWMKVEDRLPPNTQDVLVWGKELGQPAIGYYSEASEQWELGEDIDV